MYNVKRRRYRASMELNEKHLFIMPVRKDGLSAVLFNSSSCTPCVQTIRG